MNLEEIIKQSDKHVVPLKLRDADKQAKISEILQSVRLTKHQIQKVRDVFEEEMTLGLAKDPPKKSSLRMENTYVPELLNGTEQGEYLSLDLGGTNFRVIRILMDKGKMAEEKVQYYSVPEDVRLGEGEILFDFLASCIYDFCLNQKLLHKRLPLGFTFSFPMIQKGLDVGILVSWTKSFNCSGVVGKDAVQMLNEAIQRRGDLNVDVVAVLNDTTGTIVQGYYQDPSCCIGMILGTGSNAAYIEKVQNIPKWSGDHHGAKEVVIEVDWGAFGDNGVLDFIKTDFDRQVDLTSLFVHSFTFEKYFGGKYLGEIVRVILVKLCNSGLLFNGKLSEILSKHGGFKTEYVSFIEKDNLNRSGNETCNVLKELGVSYDDDDMKTIRHVCSLVSDRGAILVAEVTASLMERMDKEFSTVAIDGSLYNHHPRLKAFLEAYIKIMAPGKAFKLMLAEDGSGKGAALTAAIANRLQKQTA